MQQGRSNHAPRSGVQDSGHEAAPPQLGEPPIMWDHLPVHNMISLQRAAAYKRMGQQAAELLAQGYAVEADRILDQMIDRKLQWEQEKW
jgi:hypothetical protein